MKKISRFERYDVEPIASAVDMSDIGVYTDIDDYCFFATRSGYEESRAYTPSELVRLYKTNSVPSWVTHVLWSMK